MHSKTSTFIIHETCRADPFIRTSGKYEVGPRRSLTAVAGCTRFEFRVFLERRTWYKPLMLRPASRLAFAMLFPALHLIPSAAAQADAFDDLWLQGQPLLEQAGITKPMFRSLTVWMQGQYYLGYCQGVLSERDISHWRNWWDRTIVSKSEAGKALLENGRVSFERGQRDGTSQAPTLQVCWSTLETWSRDMLAANESAKAP